MQIFKEVSAEEFQTLDSLLWSQLKKGEKAGLERIHVKFSPELFRYAMALKSNKGFIKVCIQEIFIDLLKYKNSLKETYTLKPVLFRSLPSQIFKKRIKKNEMRRG